MGDGDKGMVPRGHFHITRVLEKWRSTPVVIGQDFSGEYIVVVLVRAPDVSIRVIKLTRILGATCTMS